MTEFIDYAVASLLVALLIFAWRKDGRHNPQGNARLSRRVAQVEGDMLKLNERMASTEKAVSELAAKVATRDDIDHLMQLMARDAATTQKTWAAVDRLQNYFIEQAIGGKGR